MIFSRLPLEGAYLIEAQKIVDERGFFSRMFCEESFRERGLTTHWVQMNNSVCTHKATLRGLHFQRAPFAECKLIRCIHGAVWDVIVDIRPGSVTYGQWYAAELSADNRLMLYVPEGFAHGYMSLTDGAEIIYPSSRRYTSSHEGALHWADPAVGISWPLAPALVSAKDAAAPSLTEMAPYESTP